MGYTLLDIKNLTISHPRVAAEFLQKIWWVSLSFSLSKLGEEDEMIYGDQGVVFILIRTEFPR